MEKKMIRAVITSIGTSVPDKVYTNDDLSKVMDTSDEWIRERSMIGERRFADKGEGLSKYCVSAAEKALKKRGVSAEELDLIIVATVTPDMMFPNTANLVQDKLGAVNAGAFDLVNACPGFVYGVSMASGMISSGLHKKILVCGGDIMSSILDMEDRSTAVLFGDGAGAVLLEGEEGDYGVHDVLLGSDGSGGKYLYMPSGGSISPPTKETVSKKEHFVRMDGSKVYKVGIRRFVQMVKDICEKNSLDPSDIGCHLFHQANGVMIEAIAKRLKLDKSKCPINIDKYANTTNGTIPILTEDANNKNMLKDGDWVLMTSFGAGFAWGSVLIKWKKI
tara:strand:+ start:7686 stop:8687 length:1002 start_codon:yes stop_codon:yes gene_type:complete